MRVQLVGVREQFEGVGLMRKPCSRGKTLQFDLEILRAEGSPDDDAKMGYTVLPPAEAKKDYLSPQIYLDGEEIDHRAHHFKVSTSIPRKLMIRMYILPQAKWFPEFLIDVDVVSVNETES